MSNNLVTAPGRYEVATSQPAAQRKRLANLAVALRTNTTAAIPGDLAAIGARLNGYHSIPRDQLPTIIKQAEAALATHKPFLRDLQALTGPATLNDIALAVGELLPAFPGNVDLSAFIRIAAEEIEAEKLSRFELTLMCRQLRRKAKFRPSIAEMLEVLDETRVDARSGALPKTLLQIGDKVARLKAQLAPPAAMLEAQDDPSPKLVPLGPGAYDPGL
jgi:hypothetical protein